MNHNKTCRAIGFVAATELLLVTSAGAQNVCDDPAILTPTQRLVCDVTGGSNIIAQYGGNATALQQMTTQSDVRINTTAVASATSTSRDIQCIAARRNGAPAPGCPDVEKADGVQGRRGASQSLGPFGLTVVGSWGNGDEDDSDGETGFDSRLRAITAIIDYGLAESLVTGISFGYQKSELDFNSNSGSLDTKTYRGALFANYVPAPNVFLQGLVGYGSLDNDSERVCSACAPSFDPTIPNPTRNVASYDGRQIFASIGGGYLFPIAAWHLGGYIRGDYVRTSTDGYTERPTIKPEDLEQNQLIVDSQRATSLTSALGVLTGFDTRWNGVSLTPSVRLEWVHEFKDDSRNIVSRFVGGDDGNPTPPLSLPTASPERNWANLGVNLRASFTRSFRGFIDYSHLFKEDASFDLVSAGLRYEF